MPGTSPLVSENHIIKIAQLYSIILSWLIRKSDFLSEAF